MVDCVLDFEFKDVGGEEVWGLYLSIEDSNSGYDR